MLPGRLDRPLLILIVLILLGLGLASYWNWVQVRDSMQRGAQARELLSRTNELISELKDAETGQRGYLLAGSSAYLEPYTKATAAIPMLIDQVVASAGTEQPFAGEAKKLG